MRKSPRRTSAHAKRVSPAKVEGMRHFTAWRAAGHPMTVDKSVAIDLTFGHVEILTDTISLAVLAVKYGIYTAREARR